MAKTDKPAKRNGKKRERGATTVYQALREEILTLKREPGSALDEVSIAGDFNLSRTPVGVANAAQVMRTLKEGWDGINPA